MNVLYAWKRKCLAQEGPAAVGLEARVRQLEAELRRVERDILKNAQQVESDTVNIQWIAVTDEDAFEKAKKKFGFSGGNLLGPNRTAIGVGMRDSLKAPTFGQTGKYSANMNIGRLLTFGRQKGYNEIELIGGTIAHELGLHAVGGKSGHFRDKDCIDATAMKPGTTFSSEACDLIKDRLDVD